MSALLSAVGGWRLADCAAMGERELEQWLDTLGTKYKATYSDFTSLAPWSKKGKSAFLSTHRVLTRCTVLDEFRSKPVSSPAAGAAPTLKNLCEPFAVCPCRSPPLRCTRR